MTTREGAMTMADLAPAGAPPGVPRGFALWAALLGAPVAWSLHLFASYALVALACAAGWRAPEAALAVVTVLCLIATAVAGWAAWRGWERMRGDGGWEVAREEPRAMLLLVGALLAVVFGVLILLAGLPPLFVPVCAPHP